MDFNKSLLYKEWLASSDKEEFKNSLSDMELDYLLNGEAYSPYRRTEYPPMEDYFDAIVKGDEILKQKYIDECLAVKAKYPKPE